jgi:hypothetical protein
MVKTHVDWWNNLPIQNLEDMDDSWVGYVHKYLPNRGGIYALTDDEILFIYNNEFIYPLRNKKINKLIGLSN